MRYQILTGTDLEQFCVEVQSHLASGWKLQGGVFVFEQVTNVPDTGNREAVRRSTVYHQAMVMEETHVGHV